MEKLNKPIKIILAAIIVILILGFVYWLGSNNQKNNLSNIPPAMFETQTPEAAQATKKLVDEAINGDEQNIETITTSETINPDGTISTTSIKVVTVSRGTSPINIETGRVVTRDGATTSNNVLPGTLNAPRESHPLTATSSLPNSTIKLVVTSSSFTPKSFTVNRGQVVSLAVTNANTTTFSEVFRFDDPSLSAVVIGVAKGETGAISFNAPTKAGTYTFYSSMFKHRDLGAVGTMIVQ